MKKWIVLAIVLVILMLVSSCQPPATPTPDLQGTVQAQLAVIETQTAIAQAQANPTTEQAVLEATKIAMTKIPSSTITPEISPSVILTMTPVPEIASGTISPGSVVDCPFYVYAGWGSDKNHYTPQGWMGDTGDIQFNDNYKLDSDPSRSSVIQITYTPKGPNHWSAIYWWDPPDSNFGAIDGGYNISCATTKLTFWARGENGKEKGEFKVGGINGIYKDSLLKTLTTGPIVLTKTWTQYKIPLTGADLSHIISGFVWSASKLENPNGATIYLDDIRFE
jgi:hypothetical protein